MITEDYVSFETAKLLKEKGFDEIIFTWYTGKGKFCVGKNNFDDYHMNHFSNMAVARDKNKCSAPTLQTAMKWLVQEYKLYVNVAPSVEGYYWTEKWHSHVEDLNKRYPFGRFIGTFNSREEAAEEAIKYCLENLI